MTEHRAGGSQENNKRDLAEWSSQHNPNNALIRFKNQEITAEEVMKTLEHTGKHGFIPAARIAIEEAVISPSFYDSSRLIDRARMNYNKALLMASNTNGSLDIKAEATINLAQLPIMAHLAMFKRLPSVSITEKAYRATVSSSIWAAECLIKRLCSSKLEADKLVGVVTEAAVLVLGQRYAIRSHDDGSWLPTSSLYSEDRANMHRTTTNRAWDMTVWTEFDDGDPGYGDRVKIKSSPYSGKDSGYTGHEDWITLLHFNPDLRLDTDTGLSQVATIVGAMQELEGASSASANLEERTERMLDIVG